MQTIQHCILSSNHVSHLFTMQREKSFSQVVMTEVNVGIDYFKNTGVKRGFPQADMVVLDTACSKYTSRYG